jgi:hypothetical protein
MAKLLAKRKGRKVWLPKYCNAEMLLLEFFAGERVAFKPTPPATSSAYTVVHVFEDVDQINNLIEYINENI